jgi:hypothetical protein
MHQMLRSLDNKQKYSVGRWECVENIIAKPLWSKQLEQKKGFQLYS